MHNPFHGGFVREDKDKGFYLKFTDTYIKLYRFPVSDEVYEQTEQYLSEAYENRKCYKYNLMGVVLTKFNIPLCRDNQYFCSEFVALVFDECKIRPINGDIHTYRPYFFEQLEDKELIYEGMMADYHIRTPVIHKEYTTA